MKTSDFKNLTVWQKSMDLVEVVYKIVKALPSEEKYGLSDQIRRCAVSIPSNIAEGQSRDSDREFLHFLSIARGSAAELETQLMLCVRLQLIEESALTTLLSELQLINFMIRSLRKSILTRMNENNLTTP